MHLRRALLLFALVLGLTALAASIAPDPRSERAAPPPPPVSGAAAQTLSVRFTLPRNAAKPVVKKVPPGAHAIVTVAAGEPGQATIPKLGLIQTTTQFTPASFDVVVPGPGRYDVVFQPTNGSPTRVGTIEAAS